MYMLRDIGRARMLAGRKSEAGYRGVRRPSTALRCLTPGRPAEQVTHATGLVPVPEPRLARRSRISRLDLRLVSDFDATVTFEDVALFAEWSALPVVVTGVLRGDDAERCVDAGASAIAVSNHGGRTMDGIVATADALAEIVDAVDGRAEVYVDGGIRHGGDVVKAIAIGAQAVLIGRPVLWGLTVAGAEGVAHVLTTLTDQFASAMAFCGARRVEELTPDLSDLSGWSLRRIGDTPIRFLRS